MKKREIMHYIGINKTNNRVKIATSKQAIAIHLGINAVTISRHLVDIPWYENEGYIIAKSLGINKIRTGFGRIR